MTEASADTNVAGATRIALTAMFCLVFGGQALAQQGSAQAGQTKAVTCAACHGADGNSVTPEWPNLAGQHESYFVRQMEAYRDGEREDAGMRGFAATLSTADMHDIAAFYAAQNPHLRGADPALVAVGERIYRGGIPERGVAACIACHGPRGRGNPLAAYPRVSGQHSTYVFNTLQDYAVGERNSDVDMNRMMGNVAELLFEDEMRAVASYVQGLR